MTLRRRMIAGVLALGAAGLICGASPRPAEAKLLELQLRLHGGGMIGLYGTEKVDPANTNPDLVDVAGEDFFKAHRGGSFGGTLNIEVLFIDLTYEFYQLVDGNRLGSTLNNFLIGFDWDFKAGKSWVVTPYLLARFKLATQNNSWLEKEHEPQIDLSDLLQRMVQVRIGLQIEVMAGRFFRFGLDFGLGYHYGMNTDRASNDLAGHSHGFHILGNLSVAFV